MATARSTSASSAAKRAVGGVEHVGGIRARAARGIDEGAGARLGLGNVEHVGDLSRRRDNATRG